MTIRKEGLHSICIPRVDNTMTKEYIESKINQLGLGKIEYIAERPLKNDDEYKRIIIKYKWNYKNTYVDNIKKKMDETGSLKYVYNMPWYWKICSTRPPPMQQTVQ
jgi:hypothetical protein